MAMLKRVALMFAATAVLAIPTTSAFAAPSHTNADGILPDQACLALYPEALQPALCGKGNGGPGHAGG
jgi:hypothetical protein